MLAVVLAGCQIFVPTDAVQCKTDPDCNARGGDFTSTVCVDQLCVAAGDRCLGKVPDAIEDRSKPLHSRLRFANLGGTGLAGVPVLVCAGLDEACNSPVGAPVVTDADGYAFLTVWKNFRGTFQVKNPPPVPKDPNNPDDQYFKLKIHALGAFETDDKPDRVISPDASVRLLTRSIFELQLGKATAIDPKAGQVIAMAANCDVKARAGVRVTLKDARSGAPILFYFTDDGLASTTATETATKGLFGIANVPEGPIVLEADIPSTGKKLGRVELWVNKDTISNFSLGPTPDP